MIHFPKWQECQLTLLHQKPHERESDNNQNNMIEPDMPFEVGDYIFILTPHITLTGKILTIGLKSIKLESIWGTLSSFQTLLYPMLLSLTSLQRKTIYRCQCNTLQKKKKYTQTSLYLTHHPFPLHL